jgi:uncharacterized membrane protein HdeD (DUF308 family)
MTSLASPLIWTGLLAALALVLWVAAWAFVTGVAEIALAVNVGGNAGERALLGLTGLVSVALGVVLVSRPDIGAVTLAQVRAVQHRGWHLITGDGSKSEWRHTIACRPVRGPIRRTGPPRGRPR